MPSLPCEWKICTGGFRTAENKNCNDFEMISERREGGPIEMEVLRFSLNQLCNSYLDSSIIQQLFTASGERSILEAFRLPLNQLFNSYVSAAG